jgi:hypothetical protein
VPAVRREQVHLAAVFRWDDQPGRANLRCKRCDPPHAHVDIAGWQLADVDAAIGADGEAAVRVFHLCLEGEATCKLSPSLPPS